MRQVFFVREKNTNTWCYSSKHESFSSEFDAAAIFLHRDNAEKAIKEMKRAQDPKLCQCPGWNADGQRYITFEEGVNEYTKLLIPNFEVVAFNLTQE